MNSLKLTKTFSPICRTLRKGIKKHPKKRQLQFRIQETLQTIFNGLKKQEKTGLAFIVRKNFVRMEMTEQESSIDYIL
jgi:hypothetical protein